jgi:hypothetical protein
MWRKALNFNNLVPRFPSRQQNGRIAMRKKILILASAVVLASPSPAFAYGEAVRGFRALEHHCIAEDSPAFFNMFSMNIWIRCGWF